MYQPKISIITVSYNSEGTIEETIKSILSQTYSNLEYIIVDGASTDNTMKIVQKYREKINIILSEPDNGISDAFNKGIALATGEIIGICNADDILYPDALQNIADEFEPGIDVYRSSQTILNTESGYRFELHPAMNFPKLPFFSNVCHMGSFVTKQCYEKYGNYDIDFRYSMDLEILRRFCYKGAKFKRVSVSIGEFRLGGVSHRVGEKEKKWEREQVILRYGGNLLDVWIYRSYRRLRSQIKDLLNLFGKDVSNKILSKIK